MYPPKEQEQQPTKTQILIEFDHTSTAISYKIIGSGSLIIHLGMLAAIQGMLIGEKAVTSTKQHSNIIPLPPGTRLG